MKNTDIVVFFNLIKDQFSYGGKKYAKTSKKEATDILFERHTHRWLVGTIDKYTFRYANLARERDLLKIACYTPENEVLTEKGWKKISEIVDNKLKIKVATLNINTNKVEYHYPNKYIVQTREEEIFTQKNKYLNVSVTSDHNLLVKNNNDFKLVRADQADRIVKYNKEFNYTNNKNISYYTIPKYKKISYERDFKITREKEEKKVDIEVFLAFLGLFISEGCSRNNSLTTIAQSRKVNLEKCKKIESVLDKIKFKYKIYSDKTGMNYYQIFDRQLQSFLFTFGKSRDKFIPRDILENCSVKQLNILLEYLILGDGHIRSKDSFLYSTASKQLADDVQELALKCGYCSDIVAEKTDSHSTYSVSIHKHKTPIVNTKKDYREYKFYSGKVYCLNVKNNTLFIRNSGKTFWCGNCYMYITWLKRGMHINRHGLGKVINTNVKIKTENFSNFISSVSEKQVDLKYFKHVSKINYISNIMRAWSSKSFIRIREDEIINVFNACYCEWLDKYSNIEDSKRDKDTWNKLKKQLV